VSPHLTERTARRFRIRRVGVSAVGLLLLLVLSGCSEETTDQWKRLGLPPPASDRSTYMHDLWIGSWVAAGITGVFVWGLIGWVVIRYRRRPGNELPVQVRYNLPIEVLYTIAPVVVVAVLFFFTVEKQNNIREAVENPDHNITVTGQQWAWSFSYVEEDAIDDQTVYESGNAAELPTLWLVKGESVTFKLHSPDVIHSFWVPAFYFKQDVIPGRDASFSMTPTELGEFEGRCAELCGAQHSRMLFTVNVVDRATYDAHLQDLADAGQIGELLGGDNSSTVDGLESNDEGGSE
jgi:cytochrome c oxidase subunit 2